MNPLHPTRAAQTPPPTLPPAGPRGAAWTRPLTLSWWWLALVVVSTLDLAFTHLVLSLDGFEVNPVARAVLRAADFPGLIVFKFGVVVLVVVIAEFIAAHTAAVARRLAWAAVGISAAPVVWSLLMVLELVRAAG